MNLLALPLVLALGSTPAAEPTNAEVEGWLQSLRGALPANTNLRLKARTAPIP